MPAAKAGAALTRTVLFAPSSTRLNTPNFFNVYVAVLRRSCRNTASAVHDDAIAGVGVFNAF